MKTGITRDGTVHVVDESCPNKEYPWTRTVYGLPDIQEYINNKYPITCEKCLEFIYKDKK